MFSSVFHVSVVKIWVFGLNVYSDISVYLVIINSFFYLFCFHRVKKKTQSLNVQLLQFFLSVRWCTWWNNNFFLTKYKGCTGEYWCEVMAVWTKLSIICTKITKGQYSPVWLKQARLLSSLLYETWTKLVYSEFADFVNWSTWLMNVSLETVCMAKFWPSKTN